MKRPGACFVLLSALLLPACAVTPLYAGGAGSPVAQGLAGIQVAPIEGRAGWLVRNALNDRLSAAGGSNKAQALRLDVRLDDSLEGLAVLANDTISRERLRLRARYQLVDVASGAILLDGSAGSDAGVDVVSSEYATIAAEQTAMENLSRDVADRIMTTLSQHFLQGK